MKFKRDSGLVAAIHYTGPNFDEVEVFVGGDVEFRNGALCVATTKGPLIATPGQYIVKRWDGSFFASDYEKLSIHLSEP